MHKIVDILTRIYGVVEGLQEEQLVEDNVHDFIALIAKELEIDYLHVSIEKNVSKYRFNVSYGLSPEIMSGLFINLLKYAPPSAVTKYHNTGILAVNEYRIFEYETMDSTIHNLGIRSVLSLPIQFKGENIGRITAMCTNVREWNIEVETILLATGSIIAGMLNYQKTITELRENLKKYEAISISTPDIWIIFNQRLEIEHKNNAAQEIFKNPEPKTIFDIVEEKDRANLIALLDELSSYDISQYMTFSTPYQKNGSLEIAFARLKGSKELEEKTLLVGRLHGSELILRTEVAERERVLRSLLIDSLGREYLVEEDVTLLFPSAYAISFNETVGPIIIAASPPLKEDEIETKTWSAGIRLVSSIDFEDVSQHQFVIGSFPWPEPLGTLYYIAFVIPNPKTRGGYELHLIGLNSSRHYEDVILGIRTLLLGALHHTMNEYVKILEMDQADFVSGKYIPTMYYSTRTMISKLLYELRMTALNYLADWYRLPLQITEEENQLI